MNTYVNAQILNMITITNTFEQACEMAYTQNDGTISKEEAHQLKKIKAAVQRFRKDLEKIQ